MRAIRRRCSGRSDHRAKSLQFLPPADFSGATTSLRIADQRETISPNAAEYKNNSRHRYDAPMADVMAR